MLLLWLALTAHAADLSPKHQKKVDKLDAKATQALAACDDTLCVKAVIAEWEGASVKGVPVELPSVAAARERVRADEITAAEAAWVARVEVGWAELLPRIQDASPEALTSLDDFIERFHPDAADRAEHAVWAPRLDEAIRASNRMHTTLHTTVVASPPWQAKVFAAVDVPDERAPRLRPLSARKNQITDDDAWFAEHDLVIPASYEGLALRLPDTRPAPALPPVIDGDLALVTVDGDSPVGIYTRNGARDLVAVFDRDAHLVRAFDLASFRRAPRTKAGDASFVEQEVNWATVRDGTLLVSTSHRTYAESSGGMNAYITAFDIGSGDLLWRSSPLVSNAGCFVVTNAHVIAGYGFTAEPDYLYVLDLATGVTVKRTRVKTGADWLIRRNDLLYVRTYDHDYVFRIE